MAEAPISLSSVSLVTFSGNDPNQNALEFWNSIDQKVKFSLGTTIPTDPDKKRVTKVDKGLFLALYYQIQRSNGLIT